MIEVELFKFSKCFKQFINTNVGIYADITGYGKTLSSMLGYLCKWYLRL